MPKQNRFGIHHKIETLCLDMLTVSIEAALTSREIKKPIIQTLRIRIETVKRITRISYELKIIEQRHYLLIETRLQKISKMSAGWTKSIA